MIFLIQTFLFSKLQVFINAISLYTSIQKVSFLKVYVDDTLCGTIKYVSGTSPYNIECGSLSAKHVTVLAGIDNNCIVTLCEVEVFSQQPPGYKFFYSFIRCSEMKWYSRRESS